ncbi:hypothetical protein BZG36_02451 [Bifiguratus adelaidae]|uniref:PDZ GRASP-type domain-containing protein n=1 Tax=Bifiguratus adelaidae TaxID=1938954 RepID=A0A261Y426_9FUNG|nr:hypothetical protein BZG36_02451 [Bifiguratus adelaidae]
MGGIQSTEGSRSGYHVLKVREESPAYRAGIEQFFDYIVGINGIKLETEADSQILLRELSNNVGYKVILQLYNTKEETTRDVSIIPSQDWAEKKQENDGLLGCSIRFCQYNPTLTHVWHILSVSPNSPAEMAGLIPHTDYVIGSPQMTLRSEEDLYGLIDECLGRQLRLYMYNSDWGTCREVIIIPNHEWGGVGSLGCDIGYGLLHRIPRSQRPVETFADVEMLDEDADTYRNHATYTHHEELLPSSNMSRANRSSEEGSVPLQAPDQQSDLFTEPAQVGDEELVHLLQPEELDTDIAQQGAEEMVTPSADAARSAVSETEAESSANPTQEENSTAEENEEQSEPVIASDNDPDKGPKGKNKSTRK